MKNCKILFFLYFSLNKGYETSIFIFRNPYSIAKNTYFYNFFKLFSYFQKQEKRRELRLKRFWRSPKTTSSEDSTGYESPTRAKATTNDAQRFNHLHYTSLAQSAPVHEADNESGSGGGVGVGVGVGGTVLTKVKTSIIGGNSGNSGGDAASGLSGGNNLNNKPTCSLPLLQVWPSQVSFFASLKDLK